MEHTTGMLCNLYKEKLHFQRDESRSVLLLDLSFKLKHRSR